jgi:drug/metabolite transporter (DMT)-like permease
MDVNNCYSVYLNIVYSVRKIYNFGRIWYTSDVSIKKITESLLMFLRSFCRLCIWNLFFPTVKLTPKTDTERTNFYWIIFLIPTYIQNSFVPITFTTCSVFSYILNSKLHSKFLRNNKTQNLISFNLYL